MQDEKKGVAPRSVACRASVEGALRGIFVSFSILILNALSFFFSFCVRRLLHRGASSEGSRRILFAGWRRDHTPGGRGTSSHHVVFFSILIPNTLSLFFTRWILCGPAVRPREITAQGEALRRPLMLVSFLF